LVTSDVKEKYVPMLVVKEDDVVIVDQKMKEEPAVKTESVAI
jgi:hypothetical protein